MAKLNSDLFLYIFGGAISNIKYQKIYPKIVKVTTWKSFFIKINVSFASQVDLKIEIPPLPHVGVAIEQSI